MAAVFQFLVTVWAVWGQTRAATATDRSSVTTKSCGRASSGYATPTFNDQDSSASVVSELKGRRVSTTASEVKTVAAANENYSAASNSSPTPTEAAGNTMHSVTVVSESVTGQSADNTMYTDNVVSESFPGQSADNTMYTDNVASESFPGQSADNTMYADNVVSESFPGQSADNTMYTDNVASESVPGQSADNTMYTDNVVSQSFPAKTADNTMYTDNVVSANIPGQSADNTMYTDNVVSESFPGQSADNTMYTDNVVSESVPGQSADNTMYTDNVVSESFPGQSADNTMYTDNVLSVISGTILADNVAGESVPGQAGDSLTVRSTTSAVDSGLNEAVTAPSENVNTVDKVHGSVHITSNNDDFTDEGDFTNLRMTSVSTTDTPLLGNSPATLTEHCEVALCQKGTGYFIINTTACLPNDSLTMDTSVPTTVDITTNGRPATSCQWQIFVPEEHYVDLTINQLAWDDTESDRTQIMQIDVEDLFKNKQIFNLSVLRNKSATFTSSSSLFLHFRGRDLYLGASITFHFLVQRGALVMDLPVVQLTDAVGYVTSPRFDVMDLYPSSYDGEFHLHVSNDESVLISFTHFALEEDEKCLYDYLNFNVTAVKETWRKCDPQDIAIQVYRSSVSLFFHSDDTMQFTGFKMMYAVIPRSQEPEQLPDNLYNCSVPHFHSFKPVLSCNMETECQGQEDEEGCGYQSNDCGEGAIDAGTKCYRLVRLGETVTWTDASYECINNGQNLVTLATPDEVRRFRHVMSFVGKGRRVYVGAQLVYRLQEVAAVALYKHLWRWVDGRTVFFLNITGRRSPPMCAQYSPDEGSLVSIDCQATFEVDLVCEFDKRNAQSVNATKADLGSSLSIASEDAVWNVSVVECPRGHVTRDFLSCDALGQCGAKDFMTSCHAGSVTIAMFVCERSQETVHYTLVCDHIQHCADNTDEDFCQFSPCPFPSIRCKNGQCIALDQLSDGQSDCYDASDESCVTLRKFVKVITPPPAVFDVDDTGKPFFRPIGVSHGCPLTHFQCAQGFCLPVYLRCNGVDDCPRREDEASCDSYTCPGFYRCRGSTVCLHADHVCDGLFQCPQYDDELLCENLPCPDVCQCQGLAYVCTANFSASSYPALRYLDASGSGMTSNDVTHNHFLIRLRLSGCRMDTPPTLELPNLRHLDLSGNELTHIDMQHFHSLTNLRVLVLSDNPLSGITNTKAWEPNMMGLHTIDMSRTSLDVFNGSALAGCPDLKTLNMSWSKLTTISKEGFQSTPMLENLDVRGSPLKDFPSDVLRGLVSLKVVQTDNYKLCCEAMLPADFDLNKCHSEQDLLASCDDLLKSKVYRVVLWVFASLAGAGNMGRFVAILYLGNRGTGLDSFNLFVTSLFIADFSMGVYLVIIGVADQIYRGEYLWHGDQWKESVVCKVAGFLFLVSSEVSAFTICLITLDRFLVLCFPFSRLRFSRSSALVACATVWMVGIALATVPLLPVTSHWEFYRQTGICIPLPFTTSERFQGYDYSFSVMLILNFVLFLLIAVGQAFIYWSVRSNSISSSMNTGSRDATIARRLTTIVVSDFLCWFPIGLLGLLASTGTPIPGELNVAVAILVLPFNSALNPFLYTFNVLREKRLKAREVYLLKRLETRLHTKQTQSDTVLKVSLPVNKSAAIERMQTWLNEQVLTEADILSCSATYSPVEDVLPR